MRERYSYLTGEKRSEWLKWRSEQVTSFVRKLRELLDRYNPELKLYLSIPQDPGKKNTADPQAAQNQQEPVSGNYENYGIDIDQLKTVPRVSFTLSRHPTARRHDFFWGKPESDYYETLYIQGDEEYIQSLAACPMERVKGNSDRDTAIPRDQECHRSRAS